MRIAAGVCAWCVALTLTAGCDTLQFGDNVPTGPSNPLAPGTTNVYAVVGASDVIGYGSSRPCFVYDDCNGTGYAWVAARQLRARSISVNVSSIGIPGAVISRHFQDLAISFGRSDIFGNFIDQIAPYVRHESTLVTIFAGANDVNVITQALEHGRGGSNPNGYIDAEVATFRTDYQRLLTVIRGQARDARIVILNLPNMGAMPYHRESTLEMKRWAQRASVSMTTTVINPLSDVRIVDLMCDPRFYDPANFSEDGFHPNDALYAIMGNAIADAVTQTSFPAPRSSCSYNAVY